MALSARTRLEKLARRHGVVSPSDAARAGVHSQELTRLVQAGVLDRFARGKYRLAGAAGSAHHGLVLASRTVPNGVICLLSALVYHELTTQLPVDTWVAIPGKSRKPAPSSLPIEIVRFGGAAFTEGIETHVIEGTRVRVYSVAKTLADLFKFRNKVGLEVALEALRDAWAERRFTMDALDRAAEVCRVQRVMRPYVEAIVS